LEKYLEVHIHLVSRMERRLVENRGVVLELATKDRREFKIHFHQEEDLSDF